MAIHKLFKSSILPPIDFQDLDIPHISKLKKTRNFGGTNDEFMFWQPHMCSTCSIKSIYDAVHSDAKLSLYNLIQLSVKRGVFKIDDKREVFGAYHYPIRDLLRELRIPASVSKNLGTQKLQKYLKAGKVVILSVDLTKSRHITHAESHLVLVHGYDVETDSFMIHDSADAIAKNGNAAKITQEYLSQLSNKRGIVVG